MPVSGIQSGHQILQMSQQMAEKAAHGINDNLGKQEACIIRLQELSQGILSSEGDNYVVVK